MVVATAAVPASVDVAGPGDGNTQRRRLEQRAAERRQREDAEAAAAEEGLRRVTLRHGGQGGRGELLDESPLEESPLEESPLDGSMARWLDGLISSIHSLPTFPTRLLDGAMARWLDGSIARWLDGSIARYLARGLGPRPTTIRLTQRSVTIAFEMGMSMLVRLGLATLSYPPRKAPTLLSRHARTIHPCSFMTFSTFSFECVLSC